MQPETDIEKLEFSAEVWDWCEENPGMGKEHCPKWRGIEDIPHRHCYACEIAKKHGSIRCEEKCLIRWPNNLVCDRNDSLYSKWRNTDSISDKKKCASRMAELHREAAERLRNEKLKEIAEEAKTEKHYEKEKAKRGALLEGKWEVTSHAIYVPYYGIIARRPCGKDDKRGHDNWQNFGRFILRMKAFIEKWATAGKNKNTIDVGNEYCSACGEKMHEDGNEEYTQDFDPEAREILAELEKNAR